MRTLPYISLELFLPDRYFRAANFEKLCSLALGGSSQKATYTILVRHPPKFSKLSVADRATFGVKLVELCDLARASS